jgi:hypothetical protein
VTINDGNVSAVHQLVKEPISIVVHLLRGERATSYHRQIDPGASPPPCGNLGGGKGGASENCKKGARGGEPPKQNGGGKGGAGWSNKKMVGRGLEARAHV